MLDALAQAIDDRDPFGTGHAQRVTELAEAVAVRLRWDEQRLAALRIGARLHDVGKLVLPQQLLTKPGALNPREWAQIRAHPVVGSTLIAPVIAARSALPCVSTTTSAGTATAIRPGGAVARSRRSRASSPWRTRSTR